MKQPPKCLAIGLPQHCLLTGVAVFVLLTVAASPSQATGWSLDASVTERASFDDNIFQVPDSPGEVYGSTTNLTTQLGYQTRTLDVFVNSNLTGRAFVGPGDDSDLDTFDQAYSGSLQKQFKNLIFDVSSSFRVESSTFNEFDDTGILTEADSDRTEFSVGGGLSYLINSRLSASLDSRFTEIDFSADTPTLTPSTRIEGDASFDLRLTKRIDLTLSAGGSIFSPDDLADTSSISVGPTAELEIQLTQLLTASALVGFDTIITEADATPTASAISSTSVVELLEGSLTYETPLTQFVVAISRTARPSAFGEIQESDSITTSIAHTINSRTSFRVQADAGRSESLSGDISTDREFFTLAPTLSFAIAEPWQAQVGYLLRLQDTAGGSSISNSAFVSLTRQLTIIP